MDSWDPLTEVKNEDGEDSDRIWRIQAHARNSISAMKLDPVAGKSVSLTLVWLIRSLSHQLMTAPLGAWISSRSNRQSCLRSMMRICWCRTLI